MGFAQAIHSMLIHRGLRRSACRWTPRMWRSILAMGPDTGCETCQINARALSEPTVLNAIFTWWNAAPLGLRFHVGRRGVLVGKDEFGSRYYEAKDTSDSYDGRKRRWVIYEGYAEASKVPPDWHGWLHYTFDEPPTTAPLKRRPWEKDHKPNLTGTLGAWRPQGSISRGGERQAASGDYQPWTPE